jgi:hypothetical protein
MLPKRSEMQSYTITPISRFFTNELTKQIKSLVSSNASTTIFYTHFANRKAFSIFTIHPYHNMKKLLLLSCLAVFTFKAFAQSDDDDHKITLSVVGGENTASLKVSSSSQGYVNSSSDNPISIGVSADFKFSDYFSIRPCLYYSGMGGDLNAISENFGGGSVIDEYTLHYIEVPLPLIFHLTVGTGANIYLGGGPFLAYALSGTNKQTLSSESPVVEKMSFGSNGDFKSTDFGATSILGFQAARGWTISLSVEFGLTNIMGTNTTGFDVTQLKTTILYFGFGQSF